MNIKTSPQSGFRPNLSCTSPDKPLKLLRICTFCRILQQKWLNIGLPNFKPKIALEQSVGYDLLKDAETATKTYGNLLKKAVEDGINYRKEKNQKIDESSNIPIQRFNESTGATIEEISIPEENETENTNN
jgi:hypothetical protein